MSCDFSNKKKESLISYTQSVDSVVISYDNSKLILGQGDLKVSKVFVKQPQEHHYLRLHIVNSDLLDSIKCLNFETIEINVYQNNIKYSAVSMGVYDAIIPRGNDYIFWVNYYLSEIVFISNNTIELFTEDRSSVNKEWEKGIQDLEY